jgi:hypothetical protein
MPPQPPPPHHGAKPLGEYKGLGRGPYTSYYRRLAARTGHRPDAGILGRLWAFTTNIANWGHYIAHGVWFLFTRRHPFRKNRGTEGIHCVNGNFSLSVAGDWATGTDEAVEVIKRMKARNPDYTIHLGDVYYIGDLCEVEEHWLGIPTSKYTPVKWEPGKVGSFALCGNHEMYACGDGYYEDLIPTLGNGGTGQRASYFCLRNKYWRVIGIDTGYNSRGFWGILSAIWDKNPFRRENYKATCRLRPELIHWLGEAMAPDPDGTVPTTILMSHHNYCSGFGPSYPIPGQQLHKFFGGQPLLWFWGHEHRFAVYDKFKMKGGITAFGRCVGHGGMPVERGIAPHITSVPCLYYDDRRYDNGEGIDVGYNGYMHLEFMDKTLVVTHYDLYDNALLTESWSSAGDGGIIGPTFAGVNGLTPGPALGGPNSTKWQALLHLIKSLFE